MRLVVFGVALLSSSAPVHAQGCGIGSLARLDAAPGLTLCSGLTATTSSASLWRLPALASRPSAYDAFLDATALIPRREGVRGWSTAEVAAMGVGPSVLGVALVGELGGFGLARLNLPARALDYFRSDTLADSLAWSFDDMSGIGVAFRFVGGGALVSISDELAVGATVRFLQAEGLTGGRVSGGVLETFRGLDVDLEVSEYGDVRGSGRALALLAVVTGDRYRTRLSLEQIGASRLSVATRVRGADSTYEGTQDAIDALRPTRSLTETIEVDLPTRASLGVAYQLDPRLWLRVDTDLLLAGDLSDANRAGATLSVRPGSWLQLDAGAGWSSGIDALVGVGASVGRVTWRVDGLTALNGRNVRLVTAAAVRETP